MNLFRNLLFWIVLALVGALVAQLLVQEPGYVLVRYRGIDYTTTVAAALLFTTVAASAPVSCCSSHSMRSSRFERLPVDTSTCTRE